MELGVTLDALALLRESRKARSPDPVFAALVAEQAGATSINVQVRGDRRHVQERDVTQLRQSVTTELNLIVAPTQEMIRLALGAKPDRVTFIPERLEASGSGGGIDVLLNASQLKERVRELKESSILPALYLDPAIEQLKAAHQVGAMAVELSAEAFVAASDGLAMARDAAAIDRELSRLSDCARLGAKLDLHVSVGHGLTLANAGPLVGLSALGRVNVGHDLVARAVMVGFETAVKDWLALLARPSV